MSITTYDELQAAIDTWAEQSYSDAQKEEFIALAEARLNRKLRAMEMETRVTATLDSEYLELPDDFQEIRSIEIQDDLGPVEYITPPHLRSIYASTETGRPQYYTITDGQFQFAPAPGSSYTIEVIYYKKIPALSDANTSNWVLASHPDLYLWTCLSLQGVLDWNDERAVGFAQAAQGLIEELNAQDRKRRQGAAPIRMKTGNPIEPRGMIQRHTGRAVS